MPYFIFTVLFQQILMVNHRLPIRVLCCFEILSRRTAWQSKADAVPDVHKTFGMCIALADSHKLLMADAWPTDLVISYWFRPDPLSSDNSQQKHSQSDYYWAIVSIRDGGEECMSGWNRGDESFLSAPGTLIPQDQQKDDVVSDGVDLSILRWQTSAPTQMPLLTLSMMMLASKQWLCRRPER